MRVNPKFFRERTIAHSGQTHLMENILQKNNKTLAFVFLRV